MKNTPILGIDLGTTNSACAIWEGGAARFIPNAVGALLTPSVVGLDDDNSLLVGQAAKERLLTHPDRTVGCFKRLMGAAHTVKLAGRREFSAIELSALVLKSLKSDAEKALGMGVSHAVISVPAYFNEHQRQATRDAGELAGITVNRLINEPTAAALAHGLVDDNERRFMVLDLGGGTFDVSILESFDGVLEVHATSGDSSLGGEDFNEAILRTFVGEHDLVWAMEDPIARQRLYVHVETAKRRVKANQSVPLVFEYNGLTFTTDVSETYIEAATSKLLLRIRAPIERAMRDASVTPRDIEDIVLVGGSARLGVFRSLVAKLFGKLPRSAVDPDLTIVDGAAIQAGLVSRDQSLEDVVLIDVCPFSLGIAVSDSATRSNADRLFAPILERNCVVPASRIEQFMTLEDKQRQIVVSVYQGESRWVKNNLFLGSLMVPVPSGPAGKETISVRFSYDVNGLLDVDVTVESTGKRLQKLIENRPGSLSKKEKAKSAARLKALKVLPRERAEIRTLLARADRIYASLLGDDRLRLGEVMSEFNVVLARQDPREIERASTEFAVLLSELDRDIWS